MGKGQKLWKRAKQIIPGGNMLLSKRGEMFLPEHWPSYFSRAKGCEIWDLDNNRLLDMCIMGIGTCTLGYGHPEVDAAARHAISNGVMSSLNAPEEVFVAEKLIEMHDFAEMVRFARSGGEANAIAIRIARAASGKDKVAFCGYHGWHDWYLAANLGTEDTLGGHLLGGLSTAGVPNELEGSILPFSFNRLDELEALILRYDIGVIKMEVSRNFGPEPGFLEAVRKLATENGIVLVFDECTSGFRETFGGLHKKYSVNPDIAVFGKAIGNGYALTAVVGCKEVMESAQSTFISSTFWTERIGSAAALATLKAMEDIQSWETITQIGMGIRQTWADLANRHNLSINIAGIPAISSFSFDSKYALGYKTLLTQEMLKRNILASNLIYVCTEHTQAHLDRYYSALDDVFALIAKCEDGLDVMSLLEGPVCHTGFQRLN